MIDLLVRNANLPDGREKLDIAVNAGRITEVAPHIAGEARETLDAAGQLVSPPFVDAHFHMDATLSYGLPRINQSGTLLEGIALWGELKPQLTFEAIVERAMTYCDWAVAKGLLAIRSHVDVCDPRLLAVEALLDVKKRVAPYLDLQLVAFPQDGVLRSPGALANLERALELGVEVVGGIPHFERTMADGAESVRLLCELAARRGLRVDAGGGERCLHVFALRLAGVDTQIERRALVHACNQGPEVRFAERGLQRLGEPVGQVVAQLGGQAGAVDAGRLHGHREGGPAGPRGHRCARRMAGRIPGERAADQP